MIHSRSMSIMGFRFSYTVFPWASVVTLAAVLQPTSGLIDCLNSISSVTVISQQDYMYNAAMQCHNSERVDRVWSPWAIVKVNSAQQVAEAVKCASAASVKVTARCGAHGFENAACSGGLIIDLSGLESLEQISQDPVTVKFGSGHLYGQLYKKLSEDYGLVVPGGTENSVGTAGLWLGCGRGLFAQIYGLTCDNVLEVEFVDAQGNIRTADSTHNTDMYWMARGSGGEFPGIVTKFTALAYTQPSEVWIIEQKFHSTQIPQLVQAWADRVVMMSNPVHSMFAPITIHTGKARLYMTCFDCTDPQKQFMKDQFDDISNLAGGGHEYYEWTGTWMDRLLKETWDAYDSPRDLAIKSSWPEVWPRMTNGAHMVHSTQETNDAMLGAIQHVLEENKKRPDIFLYIILSSIISSSPSSISTDSAYGGRSAKYVVHYKFQGNDDTNNLKSMLREFSIALDDAGLQCKSFYNYADREFPCTQGSGQAWLEAHFSNVTRMRTIKQTEDPTNLFISDFKMQKWDNSSSTPPDTTCNNVRVHVGGFEVGGWGGTCTCPDGSVYLVGDNYDACKSLACIDGTPGTCSQNNLGGEGYRVICDTTAACNP